MNQRVRCRGVNRAGHRCGRTVRAGLSFCGVCLGAEDRSAPTSDQNAAAAQAHADAAADVAGNDDSGHAEEAEPSEAIMTVARTIVGDYWAQRCSCQSAEDASTCGVHRVPAGLNSSQIAAEAIRIATETVAASA